MAHVTRRVSLAAAVALAACGGGGSSGGATGPSGSSPSSIAGSYSLTLTLSESALCRNGFPQQYRDMTFETVITQEGSTFSISVPNSIGRICICGGGISGSTVEFNFNYETNLNPSTIYSTDIRSRGEVRGSAIEGTAEGEITVGFLPVSPATIHGCVGVDHRFRLVRR